MIKIDRSKITMKSIAIAIVFLFSPSFALANCPALDYQEMKEMKVGDLSKEYCAVKAKIARYAEDSRLERKYSADLADVNLISRSRDREDEIDESRSKALKFEESADQCKSQAARMERVLALNGLAEADIKAICSK